MNGIFTVITALLGILGGGGAFISWILYRKQQERFKTAEAFEKEVIALRATVELLQQQVEFYAKRISEMQTLVVNKDEYIIQLTKEKHIIEMKHAKNKSAINLAYECTFCKTASECPVLKKRTENEDEYVAMIEKRVQKTEVLTMNYTGVDVKQLKII